MKARYINTLVGLVLMGVGGAMAQTQQPAPLPPAYPADAKINYMHTWTAMRPGLDTATIATQSVRDVKQVTEYLDGLGRPLQAVAKGGSLATGQAGGQPMDMVSMHLYDPLGREPLQYMPYAAPTADGKFKTDPFAQQQTFMQQQYGAQNETFFYGKTEFEPSPLARPLKTMPPGNSWAGGPASIGGTGAGRGVSTKYWLNTVADSVRIWNVTGGLDGNFGTYTSSGIYLSGELYKTVTIDEHGQQTVELKDREGNVVLKKVQLTAAEDDGNGKGHTGWLCTYYLYDMWDNLRCVLQPKAVEQLMANGWAIPASGTQAGGILDGLAFQYAYDGRNRMAMKKVPGAGETYMVYDNRDRLVLTQDANQRALGKWLYTQYDALNRPIATGLWATALTAAQLRTQGDPLAGMTAGYEELTRTFYDDYNWLSGYNTPLTATYNPLHNGHLLTASNTAWPYAQQPLATNGTKTLVTGSRTKILGSANDYVYTLTHYDDKGRAVQVQSTNASGGTDIVTTQYSWNGQPLLNVATHQYPTSGGQTATVITQFTYDDLWRLAKMEKKVAHSLVNNGAMPGAFTTLSQLEYDALGQLKKKVLAPSMVNGQWATGNGPLETLAYDYNIRGWLLGVNRDYIKGMSNNWFGFDLGYDKPATPITGQTYAQPQYNGNIGGTVWKAASDAELRKYDFGYDAANRLTGADFNQLTSGSFNKTAGLDFSVGNLRYDANGNILSMAQQGWKPGGSSFIDRLRYGYELTGNKLISVYDTANDNASKLGDFKYDPVTKTATDYSYDANGNLTLDNNKRITGIAYNHLNLPQTITVAPNGTSPGGSIEYVYDAAGNKLKKIVKETGKPDKVTDYIGGFVYEDGRLQLLGHEEGRIRLTKQYYLSGDSAWTLQYDYFLKDHLGNVRTVLTGQKDTAKYAATFETAQRGREEALFANISRTAYPIVSIVSPAYPTDNTTEPNEIVGRLDGKVAQLGATLALKVMAGDRVDIGTKAWVPFAADAPGKDGMNPVDLLAGLVDALASGAAGLSGGKATPTELQTANSPMLAGINEFLNGQPTNDNPEKPPRAFLNWILFDEQFKYVPSGSGCIRVDWHDDLRLQTLMQEGLPIAKSGYLFVYVSYVRDKEAEGGDKPVFFDNLTVQHYTGPLVEENVYYPFGLKMAGICSRAMGRLTNKEKTFQGQRFDDELGLGWVQFKWRNHDPQIGRFVEIDPLAEKYVYNSTYAFSENKVTGHVELEGLEAAPTEDKRGCPTGIPVVNGTGNLAKGFLFGLSLQYQIEPTRGATVTGIRDTKAGGTNAAGKAKGIDVVRVDQSHGKGKSAIGPHLNINEKVTGVPDPHTKLTTGQFNALNATGKTLDVIGKIAKPVAIVTDAIQIADAVKTDVQQGTGGDNTIVATAKVAGGWGGAALGAAGGAKIGATIGTFFGPGVGTAVGGFLGGLIGGIGGAIFGSDAGEAVGDKIVEIKNKN
jgi:RHS repeat-associated protein